MTWQDDANAYWDNVRAEFASSKRKFTVIRPQPLAHEELAKALQENARLRSEIARIQSKIREAYRKSR